MADKTYKLGSAEHLAERIDLYEDFQKKVLLVRLSIILIIFVMICAFVYGLAGRMLQFSDPKLQAEITREVSNRIRQQTPVITSRFRNIGERVVPAYSKAIQEFSAEKMPEYLVQAAEEQQALLDYLQTDVRRTLETRMTALMEQEAEKFLQKFPELADEEVALRLASNVEEIFSDSLREVLEDKFSGHIANIAGIQNKITTLYSEVEPDVSKNTEAKLLAATLELAGKKLSRSIDGLEGGN